MLRDSRRDARITKPELINCRRGLYHASQRSYHSIIIYSKLYDFLLWNSKCVCVKVLKGQGTMKVFRNLLKSSDSSICETDTNLYQNSRFLLCLLFFHNSRFLLYLLFFHYNVCIVTGLTFHCLDILCYTEKKTSQVTYETMVPRVGNETLHPLGVAMGELTRAWSIAWLVSEDTYIKTLVSRRRPMTSLPARPQYKERWENTSFASSSEACVRSMAHSLGDAVSRSPLGELWLHT